MLVTQGWSAMTSVPAISSWTARSRNAARGSASRRTIAWPGLIRDPSIDTTRCPVIMPPTELGAGDLVVDGAESQRGEGQRKQADNRLAWAHPRPVDRHHTLPGDHAPDRAPGDAPARDVVAGADGRDRSEATAPPGDERHEGEQTDVDRSCCRPPSRGHGHAGFRLPTALPQQMQAHDRVMKRQLGQHIEGPRQAGPVSLDRCRQPALARLDAEATTTIPDQQAAFDRQLHARPRRLCPSEADDLQRTQKQRRTSLGHESERQLRHVQVEALAELATGDRTRGRHRILEGHASAGPTRHTRYVEAMAKLEFSAAVVIHTSPERAFDYFADYHPVAKVLEGVTRWEPIGSTSTGIGARFNVEMVAMGWPLRNVLRLNRWRRPHEIGWVSESGLIKQEGGFTFTKAPKGVRVELRIAYVPPASVIGALVARRLDWVVKQRLERALERIRATLERSES